ncbi:hypothetical protein P9112_003999 [Eukaryota sp. TZLM1-RC]
MFKRAAFGLRNISVVFQNVTAEIFSGEGVSIYVDDIIIVGITVLEKARTRRVCLKLPKCHFVSSRHPIKLPRSRFQHKTRTINPTRIESLLNFSRSKTVKDVRSLIGSVNRIREWLPQVTKHVAPIIKSTQTTSLAVDRHSQFPSSQNQTFDREAYALKLTSGGQLSTY